MRRVSAAALMAAAAALLLLTWTISYEEQETRRMFVEWKAKHGKTYKDVGEEECRYAVFKDTRRRRIDRYNAAPFPEEIIPFRINQFGDLTREERRGMRVGKEEESWYEEETRRMFVVWKSKYGKTYKHVGEEVCRYKLFKGNRRYVVDRLNAAADGDETAYGLNQFGDLTNDEVRRACYYRNKPDTEEGKLLSARCQAAANLLPDTVDERRLIKSQVINRLEFFLFFYYHISIG